MRRLLMVVLAALALALPFAAHRVAAQEKAFLAVANDAKLGAILTDGEGKTLYLFTKDSTAGESACDADCAANWPPLMSAEGMSLPEGLPGELGTIDRADGTQQATYNDIPLYHFAQDDDAGDVYGEGVGGVWFVVHPGSELGPYAAAPGEGTPVPAATLNFGFTDELGPYLVDADGKSVYLFTMDTKAGESACDADCAANWPPVPASEAMSLPDGIPGTLGSLTRADGSMQLTYNDIPLYHYAADTAPGDVNGQEVGDVWYVVTPGMKLGDEPHESEEHEEQAAEATPAY
jgi:predicted lipoprotein with Yx(FWY)xxD motif